MDGEERLLPSEKAEMGNGNGFWILLCLAGNGKVRL